VHQTEGADWLQVALLVYLSRTVQEPWSDSITIAMYIIIIMPVARAKRDFVAYRISIYSWRALAPVCYGIMGMILTLASL
jgi:hypothetical protein